MSVLNDINVQDGYAIRIVAGNLCTANARRFIKAASAWDAHRMDTITFSLPAASDKDNAVELANAHWKDAGGNYCWGTPDGTWAEFCKRVLETRAFFPNGIYFPPTSSCVTETLSRDLLLSTYTFPFLIRPKDEDPCTREFLLPILEKVPAKKLKIGSRAVYDLVNLAGEYDRGDLDCFNRATENLCSFNDFSSFSTFYSVGTSINCNDFGHAILRTHKADWGYLDDSRKYLSLANLANYLLNWMGRNGRKGQIRKLAIKRAKARARYERDTGELVERGIAKESEMSRYDDLVWREFRSGKANFVGKVRDADKFRAVGSNNVVLCYLNGIYYLLTREDLKNLKFAAMSHSMWHVYAGTIKVEYAETSAVTEEERRTPLNDRKVVGQLSAAAKALANETVSLLGQIPQYNRAHEPQRIVPYDVVKKGLADLWKWYRRVISDALYAGSQDYVGRYLDQTFAIYTAKQGGILMANTIKDAIREVEVEYSAHGFSPTADIESMLEIFGRLPTSAVHDFGRLAKIVPAYDANPIYSFLDRCAKMRCPNPRGNVSMTGDYTFDIRVETGTERDQNMDRFRAGARVMITMADVRQRALSDLPPDDQNAAKADPFFALIARLKLIGREINTAVRFRNKPDLYVPDNQKELAAEQARDLIKHGTMPSCEYAGAYLDITSTISYIERGDPDLAIIKATSIVSGQLHVALSNLTGVPRATPTRVNDSMRDPGSGTMITDYLLGKFPTRHESLAFVADHTPIASTSDKLETNKYPMKTRVITSMCAEGRRIQGEFEYNNGKVLIHVPGFMVGLSPADRLKRTYASLKDDSPPGRIKIYGSLDLSSFSQGMHWDIQQATNTELFAAYGLDKRAQSILEACTMGTYMIRVENNLRLFTVNDTGSNYEGLDGKKNTFMHCVLWYLARCETAREGIEDALRAFIYIDDGAFSIEVNKDDMESTVASLRTSLVRIYTLYGFKLNLPKTVISTSYMQFLNEIFQHGIHIGYGFRALCHTAAQSFPTAASISEELAVITGGIRGAGVAGGHSLRLSIGFNYILWLYVAGVVGSKGVSLKTLDPYILSTILYLPTIAGGFGIPNWTRLFSNLAGNRDIEKLDMIKKMSRIVRLIFPSKASGFKAYVRENMVRKKHNEVDFIPDRVTIAHPATSKFGDLGRNLDIARNARKMCRNSIAAVLLDEYVRTGGKAQRNGVTDMIVRAIAKSPVKLPMVIIEKALSTDSNSAIVVLIKKVSSSFLIERIMPPAEIAAYNRVYRVVGETIIRDAENILQ